MPPPTWQAALWRLSRLNIAVALSSAERLVGPGRACVEPPSPSFPPPPLSVFFTLGAGKALGPPHPLCAAQARGIPYLARML